MISPNDTFAKVFRKEHLGHVHGVGMGICPSSVFGCARQQSGVTSTRVNSKLQIRVQSLKSKLTKTKEQLNFWQNAFIAYI